MSTTQAIAQYLADHGLGTMGTDVFFGVVPANSTGLVVIDLVGMPPDPDIPTSNPAFQVMIRAAEYEAGATKMRLAKSVLHQLSNVQIGSDYFYNILATNPGGHIGRDEAGHDLFSINFGSLTR